MLQTQLKNKEKNPKAIFRDSVSLFSTNHSERTLIMNEQLLEHVNHEKALDIFRQRFANPADFTFVFVGQIDPNDPQTKELILQWLGGLKGVRKTEKFKDWQVRQPEGDNKLYFRRDMTTRTATNRIEYALYDIPYSLSMRLNMQMVGRVLDTRYLESVREREGGSYGVGVGGGMKRIPVNEQYLIIQFDTDPEKQERIMQIINEEIETILRDGPLASDVDKEKASMLKDHEENLRDNDWWQGVIYRFYRDGENVLENYVSAVEGITQESVRETLQRLVSGNSRIEVVMLPE
jgi:zinc protease